MEYVLQTNNLCKFYKDFKALKGLTMNVPKGAIYGFVGRNGAGKTTLIRLICGLQLPTDGNFKIFGITNTDKNIYEARNRIGAVVENPAFFPEFNARKNLEYQYRLMGLPNNDGIDDLLKLVGLEDTGDKKVKNFSLGMRQRLGIAVALSGNQDLLILDEPINGLDPQGIIEIRELILKLNQERGITFIISSHFLDELSRIATHYGFVDSGKIVKEMSKEELENECRKCIRVKVSDIRALTRVLDSMKVEYLINNNDECDIFDKIETSDLVHRLDMEDCKLISCSEKEETLESFYLSLLGGGSHE